MNDTDLLSSAHIKSKPKTSERIQKICSWAMITLLDLHPRKTGMLATLVAKLEEEKSYRVEADPVIRDSLEDIFAATKLALEQLQNQGTVEAYALLVDSCEDVIGMPEIRPPDSDAITYHPNQPVMFMYAGEASHPEGILVVQYYEKRRLRSGAAPFGEPLIITGPDSLLY